MWAWEDWVGVRASRSPPPCPPSSTPCHSSLPQTTAPTSAATEPSTSSRNRGELEEIWAKLGSLLCGMAAPDHVRKSFSEVRKLKCIKKNNNNVKCLPKTKCIESLSAIQLHCWQWDAIRYQFQSCVWIFLKSCSHPSIPKLNEWIEECYASSPA